MKKAFIESLLEWRGLPNLLVIIGMTIALVSFLVSISLKEMQIEEQHQFIISQLEKCINK